MPEASPINSFSNIQFPQMTPLIKWLQHASFVINDIILIVSSLVFLAWVTNLGEIKYFLFQKLAISPFTSVLFILTATTLLFGAKRHRMSAKTPTEKEDYPWWNTWIPILLAATTAVLGFINFIHFNTGALSLFHTTSFGGFCFFLIGLALIPPFTGILHRFHYTQLLTFLVGGLSVYVVLETIYQLFSPLPVQHILSVSLPTASFFALLSFEILIRWSNRGFFGNFTLDSTLSRLALRLFLINMIIAPLIALIVLAIMQKTSSNMYQILTIVVACFTAISILLLWINVKLLYGYDLEHLLMRESLRTHNIDLTSEKEDLRKKMAQLEQDKQVYLDKLDSENKLQNIADDQA